MNATIAPNRRTAAVADCKPTPWRWRRKLEGEKDDNDDEDDDEDDEDDNEVDYDNDKDFLRQNPGTNSRLFLAIWPCMVDLLFHFSDIFFSTKISVLSSIYLLT